MIRPYLLFVFLLSACGQYVENLRSDDFEPIYLATTDDEVTEPEYGAIYNKNQSGLFTMESRAHRIGDILTVSFTESFQATKSQNAATAKKSDSKVTLPNILENLAGTELIPESADLSASSEQSFTGSGSSNQSNSLKGLISVPVSYTHLTLPTIE